MGDNLKNTERLSEFDFVRAIATIIIVIFHFSCCFEEYPIGGFNNYFLTCANGRWGSIAVTIFFALSGAVLFTVYGGQSIGVKTGKFYKKRWLSIFPMYYAVYLILYIGKTLVRHSFLWVGSKWRILLVLLGFDGYFHYAFQGTPSVLDRWFPGEWFLGPLILLYVLFPLLMWLVKKAPFIASAGIILLFGANLYFDPFTIDAFNNIITCILSFWIGILYARYKENISKWVYIVAAGLFIFLILINLNALFQTEINLVFRTVVTGYFGFIALIGVGRGLARYKIINHVSASIGKYSYAIFLVHHVILDYVMKRFSGYTLSIVQSIVLLCGLSILIFFSAWALYHGEKWTREKIKQLIFKNTPPAEV